MRKLTNIHFEMLNRDGKFSQPTHLYISQKDFSALSPKDVCMFLDVDVCRYVCTCVCVCL